MARPILNLKINVENIHCYDEGDGWGSAEPYLWIVFFKIDGDSYAYETGSGLIGFPTIFSTNGHHGNLNNTDVNGGDDVLVPEGIGVWSTTLKPIPINDPVIKAIIGDDLPAICGVAVVLMEQDDWPDNLADVGYNALVNSVTFSVAQVAASFQHASSVPTQDQIDAAIAQITSNASTMVHDAIEGAMSGIQTIWFGTVGNNDDEIGTKVWNWTSDDFSNNAFIEFEQRWKNEGDWEISGTSIGVVPCPADALQIIFGSGPKSDGAGTMQEMRRFREKEYKKYPGLMPWWRLLSLGSAHLIQTLSRDPKTKEISGRLFKSLGDILKDPDKVISAKNWEDLKSAVDAVGKKSPPLRRSLTGKALHIIPKLKGKSLSEALRYVSDLSNVSKKSVTKRKKKE